MISLDSGTTLLEKFDAMKVQIALVGGQPAPVEKAIQALSPDLVVFVYSESSRDVVNRISRNLMCEIEPSDPLDPTDPVLISARADELARKYSEDDVVLNISGGLKSWSHLFGVRFHPMPNATVIYVDQNNVLWNYRTMSGSPVQDVDLSRHVDLYGQTFSYNLLSDYNEADRLVAEKVWQARGFHTEEFNKLTSLFPPAYRKVWTHAVRFQHASNFSLPSGSFLQWEKTRNGHSSARLCLIKKKGKPFEVFLESPHAVDLLFNSGWYEYTVASILSRWKNARKVYLNCVFKSQKAREKNEVDIIVEAANRFLFVECKTKINSSTDVDKFNSVVKAYSGTASLSIFISDIQLDDVSLEKCRQYGMLEPFAFAGDYSGKKADALFARLDEALNRINPK